MAKQRRGNIPARPAGSYTPSGSTEAQNVSRRLAKAQVLFHAGDLIGAGAIGRELLEVNQRNPDAWHLLGVVAFKEERFSEAEELILRAIRTNRANPYYLNSLGKLRMAQGEFKSAADAYRQALRFDSHMGAAYRGLGICLRACSDLHSSVTCLKRLVHHSPGDVDAHVELAITLRALGQFDDALGHYRSALRLRPAYKRAQRGLAETLLQTGNFHDGWHEYLRTLTSMRLPAPELQNPPFKGKRVVLYGSEGVGDEIMAAGCIPELAAQATGCTLYTDERLIPLFQRSFTSVRCLSINKEEAGTINIGAVQPGEIHLLTTMLFPYFRPDPGVFPGSPSYLMADAGRLEKWRQRYEALGTGLKVGLSWRGGGIQESRSQRSIPLAFWGKVLGVQSVHFINLQYGDTAGEIEAAREQTCTTVHCWPDADPLTDLDDFAAQVAALDLVISVDNTTVHMAGALGVPVWTLLPFAPNWRWMLDREDSVWYSTMQLLRQKKPGDWRPVLEDVRTLLLARNTSPDST